MQKSTRLDRLDRLVDDFSINSTWPIFHRLHRSTTGSTGWVKMALGIEAGLGPVDIVLDGDPVSHSPKGGRAPSPIFGPF